MKYNFLKSAFALATGSLLLVNTSCNKLEDFGDTNINPLGSTTPITAALLTNALSQLGGVALSVRPGLYVQYIAETQYTETSLYTEPQLEFGGSYSGPMYDLQSIIDRNSNAATAAQYAPSGSNANQIAVATIVKTFYAWGITDRWGDVPYSESLKGAANFFPSYDKQEDIYIKMIEDLKLANNTFDAGLPVRGDIIYGGNQTKWKKLANSLRMQMAMRLSLKFPNAGGYAANQFALAVNDPAGFISSNADNFTINYPGGAAYRHPWFDLYNGRSDYALSKTIGDMLANMGDGRRAVFGSTGATFPYGLTREQAITLPTNYSKVLADANRVEAAPVVILSASYNLLTVAEAIERGWIASGTQGYTAKAAYDAGVIASFEQWGLTSGAAYINGNAARYNDGTGGGSGVGNSTTFNQLPLTSSAVTTTNLQRIALQKYLSLFPDGTQAWSEFRRTGFPSLQPTVNATNTAANKQIPTRYVYGINEYSLAPDKVGAAVTRLPGGDKMDSKVWWDQ
jgi:hypothetical protein